VIEMKEPLNGRKVLAGLVAFFAFVALVNGAFVYVAMRTHPGLSADNAYQTGLAYNRVLAAAAAQRALGWRVTLAVGNGSGDLTVSIVDRYANPVDSPDVTVEWRRPIHGAEDRRVALERVGPGVYRADLPPNAKGYWDAIVRIVRPDGAEYRVERRLWVEG
jgi:nitrogen fixation protein FixH